jgi:hypothetical protein
MHSSNNFPNGIGRILSNLLSLEFALRLFLYEFHKTDSNEQDQSFDLQSLFVGDWVTETPLTNYDTLGKLIEKVNNKLLERDYSEQIDPSVVGLRDALAHGRVLSLQPNGPFSVIKFSKPLNGKVKVEVTVKMTPKWFKQQIEHTFVELKKVIRIAKDLGLTCFPDG